jgi:hypothetical protein
VALALAALAVMATHRLENPGLASDELLFALPALGAGGATYDPWFKLPLMVGGYLGALKTYLYMPLFAVWTPGPASVRVPSIVMAAGALLGFWYFMRLIAGRAAALGLLLLVVADPSFVFSARVDWGPTVVMQVLKAAALVLLVLTVERQRAALLWGVAVVFALGLYDKLNFIWVMNALALGSVAHLGPIWRSARSAPRRFWPPVAFMAAGTAAVFLAAIRPLMGDTHPLRQGMTFMGRLRHTLELVGSTFDGSWFHDFIVMQPMSRWPVALVVHAVIVAALAVVALGGQRPWSSDDRRLARWTGFCLLAELAVVAQLAATRMAWGAHHVLVLWPFPQAAAVLAATLAARRAASPAARRAVLAAAAAAAALVLTGHARAALSYDRAIYHARSTANPLFTPEIYDLSRFVNPRLPQVASVITADWGLRYPLRVLAPAGQRDKIRDFWAVFRDYGRGDGRNLYKEWFEGRSVMVVSYLADRRIFEASYSNWRRFEEKHLAARGTVRRTTVGSYEVVCVSPDASASELCAGSPVVR